MSPFPEIINTIIGAVYSVDQADDTVYAYLPNDGATITTGPTNPLERDAYGDAASSHGGNQRIVEDIERLNLGVIKPPLKFVVCELELKSC